MMPWFIAGALAAAIASFFFGMTTGEKSERAKRMVRENKELVAANALIDKLHQEARDKEAAHAAQLNLISTTYQGELANAKRQRDSDVAAARSGALRLRDPAARKDACGGATVSPGTAPGRRDGDAAGELPATAAGVLSSEATEFLVGLANDADEVTKQLTACQAIVIEDRNMKKGPAP